MELRAAYAFVLALFLAMALIPFLVRVAGPLGLMDAPDPRKVHKGQIPRIGGVAIVIGCLVPVAIWAPIEGPFAAFLGAAALLFLFGLLDDRFNLDYRLKLLGQLLAASVVVLAGGVLVKEVPFIPGGLLPMPLAIPFTVLVLVGITNAVNLSDGLDGLAGGISLLAGSALLLLLVADGGAEGSLLILLAALGGSLLGFLRFNTFPARLFMGDTGSQFLGFTTGVLAIMVTQREDLALSRALPLLVLGLPILDMLTVMVRRIASGHSPFKADRTHLHHRLIDSGLTQAEAVTLVYTAQFMMVVLAYLMRHSADSAILLAYAMSCGLILAAIRTLENYHERLKRRDEHRTPFVRFSAWARRRRFVTRSPIRILSLTVPLCLVIGALSVQSVEPDIGVLAGALFVVSLAVLAIRTKSAFFLERISAFTAAVIVVYLVAHSPHLIDICEPCLLVFFGGVALLGGLWTRLSSSGFRVSTLDVLILLAALTAPMLRGLGLGEIGLQVLAAIVLFYAIEILIQEREGPWDPLRFAVPATLAILVVKSLVA
ncbi:glycosyltransferase family 4 protein [Thiocapsa bogorovii]|uniref:glycosyltransferase family 4 protein n=1 Tax=Thiocapsa bogorovii TaxID=521689 RepID=UPI001E399D06|nr:MraY family glycosyltransferase [Thiocapsa bogorovii]UHD16253.1 undecaprenyl/decaprenyl-phosphate alpha-N-acetylglucosaminyl 1-phosphate transferase [Thiocapsa bogorovii]